MTGQLYSEEVKEAKLEFKKGFVFFVIRMKSIYVSKEIVSSIFLCKKIL